MVSVTALSMSSAVFTASAEVAVLAAVAAGAAVVSTEEAWAAEAAALALSSRIFWSSSHLGILRYSFASALVDEVLLLLS